MPADTACPQGHPLTRANSYRHNFKVQCRTCRREQSRLAQAKRRLTQKEAEARWRADYPAILELVDRQLGYSPKTP